MTWSLSRIVVIQFTISNQLFNQRIYSRIISFHSVYQSNDFCLHLRFKLWDNYIPRIFNTNFSQSVRASGH